MEKELPKPEVQLSWVQFVSIMTLLVIIAAAAINVALLLVDILIILKV